ncbi:UNC-45/Cro1/She4 central domain-containing protein [[Candida] zeylanoides]
MSLTPLVRDDAPALAQLARTLRDESVRASAEAAAIVPAVRRVGAQAMARGDERVTLEALRVLVNLAADSDRNRDCIVDEAGGGAEFWSHLLEAVRDAHGAVFTRTLVLLTQFARNTRQQSYYATFLGVHGFFEPLVARLQPGEDAELIVELLVCMAHTDAVSASSAVAAAVRALALAVDAELVADLVVVASSRPPQWIPELGALQTALLAALESTDASSSVYGCRQMFAASGHISAMPDCNNWQFAARCRALVAGGNGSWAVAASAVILGNCIDSSESRDTLLASWHDQWVAQFCRSLAGFGDVVQFQALHLLVNVMTPAVAAAVTVGANLDAICRACKVVLDNRDYYAEIAQIAVKFATRLLRALSASPTELLEGLYQFWGLFKDEEVLLLVLQGIVKDGRLPAGDGDKVAVLAANMVQPVGKVSITVLLEKLKTIAMVLQCENVTEVIDANAALMSSYAEFLQGLSHSLTEDAPPEILLNNAKFVAAVTKQRFPAHTVTTTCDDILRFPNHQ